MVRSLGALSRIYIISVYFLEDFEKLKNIFIACNDLSESRSHKIIDRGFPGGSVVKDPPVMQETHLQSLGWEDILEKGMDTNSSILAWRIPMDREALQITINGVTKS